MKRKTTSQFVSEAIKVHGNKYDYSLVNYINTHTKVSITCPKHGIFEQIPCDHLHKHGCPKCHLEDTKSLVFGVGNNDLLHTKLSLYYKKWYCMLQRCYDPKLHKKAPTYKECSVCKEWHTLSNFKKWLEDESNGYRDGYHLDKDIIVKGNKIYSPSTCCFIPPEINALFTKSQSVRGKFPIGVSKTKYGLFVARISTNRSHIGVFENPNDAFLAYKCEKEKLIKSLANKYFNKGDITEKVYNALMNYQVKPTD